MKGAEMLRALVMGLLCFMSTWAFADTEKDFNRQKLSVNKGLVDWIPSQGFDRIKEHEMLEMAGYYEEAEKAKQHAFGNGILIGLGSSMAIGGTSAYIYSLYLLGHFPSNPAHFYYSFIGGIVAMITSPLPILVAILRGNYLSIEQAYAVAEDYNARLMKELTK